MPKKYVSRIDAHVGKRFKFRRRELGLSCQNIADRIDTSCQFVQQIEKGTSSLSSTRMYQIADLMRVDANYFFSGLPAGIRIVSTRRRKGTKDASHQNVDVERRNPHV